MTTTISEERFLADRVNKPVAVYLVNGICLRSILYGQDNHSLFLRSRDSTEVLMVLTTAITSITVDPAFETKANPLESVLNGTVVPLRARSKCTR